MKVEDVIKGWRDVAAQGSLCGGRPVEELDVLVDDGVSHDGTLARIVLDEGCLAWIPRDCLKTDPESGRQVAAIDKRNFERVNHHRAGVMTTLKLFHACKDDMCKLEAAAILAAVVGVRNRVGRMRPLVETLELDFCETLGVGSPQEIWQRSNAAPMPGAPPLNCSDAYCLPEAGVFGRALRLWHKCMFEENLAVFAVPVRAGGGHLSIENFRSVKTRLGRGKGMLRGNADWRGLTKDALAGMVWTRPRSDLAVDLGVSDMAIRKRCIALGITQPPRGYWQRYRKGNDPRELLFERGIHPPRDVMEKLEAKFGPCREPGR